MIPDEEIRDDGEQAPDEEASKETPETDPTENVPAEGFQEEPPAETEEEKDPTGDEELPPPSDDSEENPDSSGKEDEESGDFEGELVPEEVLLSRLESLVFVYPEPITVRRLAKNLALPGTRVRELLEILQEHYADRGIVLQEIGGGFQFHTNPVNADVIRSAIKVRPLRMSRPALETLAIVAYRQPVTRAEVEDIRRVDSGGTLRFLFEKGLVRVLGRKEEPGRPIIYGTSSGFLELFGLKSLNDLPSLHEFTELWEEHREMVEEEYGADQPEESKEMPVSVPQDTSEEVPEEIPEEVPEETPEESFEETPEEISELREEPEDLPVDPEQEEPND